MRTTNLRTDRRLRMPVRTRGQIRKARAAQRISAKWKAHRAKFGTDPIMLDRIRTPFRQVDARTNAVTYFDADSLAEYIESTGDVRHPLTRVPLTEVELCRLQRASGLNLTDAIETRRAERRQRIESDTLRDFLESDVSSVVQAIADVASDPSESAGSALARCRLRHAGRFDEALANLHASVPDRVDAACDRAVETLVGDRRIVHDVVVAWASIYFRDARERVRAPRRSFGRNGVYIPPLDLLALREGRRQEGGGSQAAAAAAAAAVAAAAASPRSVPEVIRNLLSMGGGGGGGGAAAAAAAGGGPAPPAAISIHFGQSGGRRMRFTTTNPP